MSEKLTKVAYNYIDDLLEKLLASMQALSAQKPFDAKAYNNLETRYRVLQQKRNAPFADARSAWQDASGYTSRPGYGLTPEQQQNTLDTSGMSHFYQYENGAGSSDRDFKGFQSISKQPNSDPTQPEWVVLPGLKMKGMMGNSPTRGAQHIMDQMGDSLQVVQKGDPKWPTFDTQIRGTKEAWEKFTGLAPYVFDAVDKLPTSKSLGLKSEKAYNAAYSPDAKVNDPNAPVPTLDVKVLNVAGQKDVWDVGNKKNEKVYKPAIRLGFDPKDTNFFSISNLLTKELGLVGTRTNPASRTIDIYDMDAAKLIAFSQKMQQAPYKYPVKPLNDAITAATGKSIGEVKKKVGDKVKSAPLSDKVVQNRIDTNVVPPPIERAQFDAEVEQLYPGAFNPKFVSPRQAQAQKDGMYFVLGRGSSILADEPGAGKTAQSMVGADFATVLQDREAAQQAAAAGQPAPPKKKILVISPLPLIEEHWASRQDKQSKPELYLGHAPDSVAVVRTLEDYNNMGPNVRWVVVPDSSMSLSTDKKKQAYGIHMRIAEDAKKGVYGASIIDELQQFKNLDSNAGEALRIAISAGGIKHRIGLTGTPADNEPDDLYTQLRLTRHPILYDTSGVVQQTSKGFSEQFLGGAAYADKNNGPIARVNSIFTWAKTVNRDQLVQLFSTTYMRRTKNDMRDDLPAKDRGTPQSIAGYEDHWQNRLYELNEQEEKKAAELKAQGKNYAANPWQPLENEMAHAKVPYTVKSAVSHLQNPDFKLFVVTKSPDVAVKIAQQINEQLGDGTAAAVYGNVNDKLKTEIPNVFKTKGGVLKGKQLPLRCVVYTMQMGSVGLNFAVANKAIFNDIAWNPSENLQAEDRIHRIDSQHQASVEYTFFAGTYDQHMFNRVRQKEAVNKEVNGILREASLNPDKAHAISGRFIMSMVDSLLFNIKMTPQDEAYVQRKKEELKQFLGIDQPVEQPMPIPVAAGSWYNQFKKTAIAYRHLW